MIHVNITIFDRLVFKIFFVPRISIFLYIFQGSTYGNDAMSYAFLENKAKVHQGEHMQTLKWTVIILWLHDQHECSYWHHHPLKQSELTNQQQQANRPCMGHWKNSQVVQKKQKVPRVNCPFYLQRRSAT